ncbi:MAG: caspase family protein [Candidatus Nomurabacteria bacterium]|nr:caspase family protein [Candidatus Nomurabacteria bacterium]
MAIIAKFIGVDKYKDPSIRDLSGAKNDALALGNLFIDTLDKEIIGEIITGTNANIYNIKKALEESLSIATQNDTIIFFYSGHGSKDHRITGFDTEIINIEKTTFPMQGIADLFKQSKAKNILCILDCCFSGGAPAKVLEDSPIPRNIGNPLDSLSGEGRFIIAASNFDEPSYELPSTGHGILTKALIDILTLSKDETINMLSAMGDIMDIVRAEASRIGVIQTPVLLNHVTGGLTLPKLIPGKNYFNAFPQKRGVKISNKIEELNKFGIPEELTKEWGQLFKNGLNDLQLEAINEYRILENESVLVIAPTSSGKTFVGELASAKAVSMGKKSVFLFPYKALVNEKYDQFIDLYQNKLGYRVIRCTGDYLDQNNEFIKGKYDIALFTYEMFLNLSISLPSVLNQIGLVVLDEAQFITDLNRGISVELLLTNLIAVRTRGVNPQLVILSAVIGDSNNFEDWLGCRKLLTTKRPIPLIEGVMGRNGQFKYLSENGEIKMEQLVPYHEIVQRKDKPSQQDMIVPLVKSLVEKGEKIIIFRNQKGLTEGAANYLATDIGLPPALDEVNMLPRYASSSTSSKLRTCFEGGTAFHNSNLSREERRIVERVFRDTNSKIKVLVATTTVAAGINTPASTAILAEQEFVGENGRIFTIAEYKNMAGRAGRVGFNEKGKAIILADNGSSPDFLFNKYVLGKPEPLISSFDISDLDTWVIKLLVQVKDVHKNDLFNLLANTYGGYVANKKDPEWEKKMRQELENLYNEMVRLGIAEEENGLVHLTILGKVCGESVLSFRSALRLVELLKDYKNPSLSANELMAIVQILPESDNTYTPMFKKGTSESKRPREASQRFGPEIVRLLQRFTNGDEFKYYARCKKASVLFDWINGIPTPDIEETFKSNNPYMGNIAYGNIRTFADFTRFQLRSVHKIATIIFPGEMLEDKIFEDLLKSLETGIPSECFGLLNINIEMSREEYLALVKAGIKTKEQLLITPKDKIKEILESTSYKLIEAIIK